MDDHDDSHADNNNGEESSINSLDERILLAINNDPSVTIIELEGEETEDLMVSLFRGLQHNTNVRELDMEFASNQLRRTLCGQLLPSLLRENSSIQNLGFPADMTNVEFSPTAEVLCNNNNTAVETLTMDDCDIRGGEGGNIVARLMRTNRHITTIDLGGNTNLGPAGTMCIATALGHDNCVLAKLYLVSCGIGDQGIAALCGALKTNNSLETSNVGNNEVTEEGYRALASSLPQMSGLKEIRFEWEPRQVSAACVQQMIEGLIMNQVLQRIVADGRSLSECQRKRWRTCSAYVGARNKMNHHLEEARKPTLVGTSQGGTVAVPIPIGTLLWCCRRQGNAEVQASLIHPLLRSRANEIAGCVEMRGTIRRGAGIADVVAYAN